MKTSSDFFDDSSNSFSYKGTSRPGVGAKTDPPATGTGMGGTPCTTQRSAEKCTVNSLAAARALCEAVLKSVPHRMLLKGRIEFPPKIGFCDRLLEM